MDFIFLRDYSPFKKGRIVRLPPMTSAKLVAAGIVKSYEPVVSKKILKKVEAEKQQKEKKKSGKEKSIIL